MFPEDDDDFAGDLRRAMTDEADRADGDDELRMAVVAALRRAYPAVRITAQEPLAQLDPDATIWYVYRYGRVGLDEDDEGEQPIAGDPSQLPIPP